jgi:hypothetical protein
MGSETTDTGIGVSDRPGVRVRARENRYLALAVIIEPLDLPMPMPLPILENFSRRWHRALRCRSGRLTTAGPVAVEPRLLT